MPTLIIKSRHTNAANLEKLYLASFVWCTSEPSALVALFRRSSSQKAAMHLFFEKLLLNLATSALSPPLRRRAPSTTFPDSRHFTELRPWASLAPLHIVCACPEFFLHAVRATPMPRTVAVLHGGRIAKLHGNDAANTHLLALQNFNQCCSKQPLDLMSEPSHSSIYIYIHICTHIYIYIHFCLDD